MEKNLGRLFSQRSHLRTSEFMHFAWRVMSPMSPKPFRWFRHTLRITCLSLVGMAWLGPPPPKKGRVHLGRRKNLPRKGCHLCLTNAPGKETNEWPEKINKYSLSLRQAISWKEQIIYKKKKEEKEGEKSRGSPWAAIENEPNTLFQGPLQSSLELPFSI